MKQFQPYKIDKRNTVFLSAGKYYTIDEQEIQSNCISNTSSNVIEMIELNNMTVKVYRKEFDEIIKALKISDIEHKYNFKNVIKHVAFSLLPKQDDIEPIEKEEYNFINENINCSQPRYKTTHHIKLENCKLYDVNSLFPSIFCKSISIPTSKAKFTHADDINVEMKKFEVAFYNIDISFDNDLKYIYECFDKKKSWFSKVDISVFIEYGIDFKLKDGVNKMYYDKVARICQSSINALYKLKLTNNSLSKVIIKQIHGVMIQRKFSQQDRITEKCFLKHTEIAKREYECEYPTLWRTKLVIYPMCRNIMSKYIKKILDDGHEVYRVATDSIMFPTKCKILDDLLNETKMGAFKNELQKKFPSDEYDYKTKYYFATDLTLTTENPKNLGFYFLLFATELAQRKSQK